jgi:hypothetical protein
MKLVILTKAKYLSRKKIGKRWHYVYKPSSNKKGKEKKTYYWSEGEEIDAHTATLDERLGKGVLGDIKNRMGWLTLGQLRRLVKNKPLRGEALAKKIRSLRLRGE